MTSRAGFAIELVDAGPPAHFRCSGQLDLATAPRVWETLGALDVDVLLDFSEVTLLDSSGVTALLSEQRRLSRVGQSLRLKNLQETPERSLRILGLLDVLT